MKKLNLRKPFQTLLSLIILLGLISGCAPQPKANPTPTEAINEAVETEIPNHPVHHQPDLSKKAELTEFKHTRDAQFSRIFEGLRAENDFANFVFEHSDLHDRAAIEAIYDQLYELSYEFLSKYQLKTAEKPEFWLLEKDGAGKKYETVEFLGKRTMVPYAEFEKGEPLESLIRGLAYESEPWLSYGIAQIMAEKEFEPDLSFISDIEVLPLSGLSFELPYVSHAERQKSLVLAGSFLTSLISTEGEEIVQALLDGEPGRDVYASLQEWSGQTNAWYDEHPESLFGKYAYYDFPGYFVRINDGESDFYFRTSEDEFSPLDNLRNELSPFHNPRTVYEFLNRYHMQLAKIVAYAEEHDLEIQSEGFNVFTNSLDLTTRSGRVDGNNLHFGYDAWRYALERDLVHATFKAGTAKPWFSEGLTNLLTKKVLFSDEEISSLGAQERSSAYNMLRGVLNGSLGVDFFMVESGLKLFQDTAEAYSKYESLDAETGVINYEQYLKAAGWAWLQHAKRNGLDPINSLTDARIMNQVSLGNEIWASYVNYLIEEKGYDTAELIRSVQNGNYPVEYDDYFRDWLSYIKYSFEIDG